jgi:DNA-directed RNA polymerase specialized sigma24 family protein
VRHNVNPAEIADDQTPEVSQVVEHLFRHEAGKMVATLARIFGLEHLTLAEDVVQEALSRALQTWPFYGIPKNPDAWIMRAYRSLNQNRSSSKSNGSAGSAACTFHCGVRDRSADTTASTRPRPRTERGFESARNPAPRQGLDCGRRSLQTPRLNGARIQAREALPIPLRQ